MLFLLQIPFSDSKKFLNTAVQLDSPKWPFPLTDREFVRHFGTIRRRFKGGISGWVGENEYCKADRALRFRTDLSLYDSQYKRIKLRCAFRRLYFDGWAMGKYDVGISPKNQSPLSLSKKQTKHLIEHCLNLQVQIKNASGPPHYVSDLANAGIYLSRLYNEASTPTSIPIEDWWTTSGSPTIFIEAEHREHIHLPYGARLIFADDRHKLYLSYSSFEFKNKQIRAWSLKIGSRSSESIQLARNLRATLLRLYAEQESLRIILGHIINGRIAVCERTKQSDYLQQYFNIATTRIGKLEKQTSKYDTKVIEIARQSLREIDPGQLETLLITLEHIRPNILNKVKNRVTQAQRTVINMNSGDTYNIGQAGAVGPQSHAHDITFSQIVMKNGETVDLKTLVQELSILRITLKQEATEPEQDAMIGAIAEAEVAAKEGDTSRIMEALAKTGDWVLDVATKIGISVAVVAIKQALGIG